MYNKHSYTLLFKDKFLCVPLVSKYEINKFIYIYQVFISYKLRR